MIADMSASLNVVSVAVVFCDSSRRVGDALADLRHRLAGRDSRG